jgi:hypothetical protein
MKTALIVRLTVSRFLPVRILKSAAAGPQNFARDILPQKSRLFSAPGRRTGKRAYPTLTNAT